MIKAVLRERCAAGRGRRLHWSRSAGLVSVGAGRWDCRNGEEGLLRGGGVAAVEAISGRCLLSDVSPDGSLNSLQLRSFDAPPRGHTTYLPLPPAVVLCLSDHHTPVLPRWVARARPSSAGLVWLRATNTHLHGVRDTGTRAFERRRLRIERHGDDDEGSASSGLV